MHSARLLLAALRQYVRPGGESCWLQSGNHVYDCTSHASCPNKSSSLWQLGQLYRTGQVKQATLTATGISGGRAV